MLAGQVKWNEYYVPKRPGVCVCACCRKQISHAAHSVSQAGLQLDTDVPSCFAQQQTPFCNAHNTRCWNRQQRRRQE